MPRLLPALLLLLALPACQGGPSEGHGPDGEAEEEDARPTDPRTLVEVTPVSTGTVRRTLVSTGTVESVSQADLVPEATGTVIAIHAEEGDLVRRGQVLAVIDNASLDAALERGRAEAARAEADLAQVEALYAQGAVSERDLREARHLADAARTALSEARSTQGHTRLVSPIDGTVSLRAVRFGEVAGGQRAFQVVDLDHLRVVVQLPERDLGDLAEGQPAVLVPVYDEDVQVEARVERISPTVDPSTGTVRVTVALPDGERRLRPGQFVSVRIEVDRHEDVAVVPRAAVVYQEGTPGVYRVAIEEPPPEDPDKDKGKGKDGAEDGDKGRRGGKKRGVLLSMGGGKGKDGEGEDGEAKEVEIPGPYRVARRVSVELGFIDDEHAEIISGVSLEETVVVVGQSNLRDGARVRLPGDPKVGDEAADEAKDKPEEAKATGADAAAADEG